MMWGVVWANLHKLMKGTIARTKLFNELVAN